MIHTYTGVSEYTNEKYSIYIDTSLDANLGDNGFLALKNNSYMLPNEIYAQEAFARAAIAYASSEAHAQRIYDYVSKCWFMFASPVISNAGNPRGLPISCLADGSKILTKDRGFVNIEDLLVGEFVLTHLGNWRPVLAKSSRLAGAEEMFSLVVDKRRTKTFITGNHPVLTNEGWVKVEDLDIEKHKVKVDTHVSSRNVPHVIDLTEHVSYDFKVLDGKIVALSDGFRKDIDREKPRHKTYYSEPEAYVHVNEDVSWAIGLWLAEGSLSTSRRGKPNGIRITVAKEELPLAEKFLRIIKDNFNVDGSLAFSEVVRNGKTNSWLTVNVNSVVLGNYFGNEFGVNCKIKDAPSWVLDLPEKQRSAVYEAFKSGDGSEQKTYNTIGLSNAKLIGTLYALALSLGKNVSVKLDTKSGKLATVDFAPTLVEYFNHEVLEYQKIISLKKTGEEKRVWDIQVKDDESFSVNGFVVHNCFLMDVDDSRAGLADSWKEMLFLSTSGGGVGMSMSDIRSAGEKTSRGTSTPGVMPFLKVVDSITAASKQGEVRRGATAVYMNISHPEIKEFIQCRKPTGGDTHRKCLNIHNAVNIPDSFMFAVTNDLPWHLIDPNSKEIRETVQARELWMEILKTRVETGEPFLHFIDTSNEALPEALKQKGLRVKSSNLCVEVILPTAPDRTAVCCLSSVNAEFFDQWKSDPFFIGDLVEMLDNVLDVFIKKAPPELANAVNSASMERSLGLGLMGFHSYLQRHSVPFEGPLASSINRAMFLHIKDEAVARSKSLASIRGEAPDMIGTGMRNAHLIAVAPNATSSDICNTSASIEPINANVYVKVTSRGKYAVRNKYLDKLLRENYAIQDIDTLWNSILENEGSVQHLDFLNQRDKEVFKTARELDQLWIIEHAADRQPFIDQGQSVNLFGPFDIDKQTLHQMHKAAWDKGLKTLYYFRGENMAKAVNTSKPKENINTSTCLSCEG
jgi:ribonucleoside-diphosphate reductase alpha chain